MHDVKTDGRPSLQHDIASQNIHHPKFGVAYRPLKSISSFVAGFKSIVTVHARKIHADFSKNLKKLPPVKNKARQMPGFARQTQIETLNLLHYYFNNSEFAAYHVHCFVYHLKTRFFCIDRIGSISYIFIIAATGLGRFLHNFTLPRCSYHF